MRKFQTILTSLFLSGSLLACFGPSSPVQAAKTVQPVSSTALHIEGATADSQDVAQILALLKDLLEASNRHDLKGVLRHYSSNFISGDSLALKDVRNLVEETWTMFPDIRYDSQVMEIRVSGDWATVESIDTATATAKVDPVVSDKSGKMKSRSRGLLYLHKTGKTWEILSDYTLYEKATILYGPFDEVNISLATPEQVFAGESYTAKINVGIPAGNIAFATVSQEPLVYPQNAAKDKFRTLSADKTNLERIFKANSTNNNEVVTATIGFTEIGQDDQERPTIDLKGILTVIKRVNVIPKSTYADLKNQPVIRSSADGKIQVEPTAAPDDEEETDTTAPEMENPELEPAPGE